MSASFFKWLDNRVAEYAENAERAIKAHATRWKNVIAAQNNGDLPTESVHDGIERFHAPYDGYIHFWVEGDQEYERTYLGGQYLPYNKPEQSLYFGDGCCGSYSINEVPVDRADSFSSAVSKEVRDTLNIHIGRVYEHRVTGKSVRNIYLNKCPSDIHARISDYLMGDIYRLQAIAEQKSEDERAARDALHEQGQPVENGRQIIEGLVLAMKWQQSDFGDTLKMLVQDDRGFRVWGSVPSKLEINREERIQFTATVEASQNDPKFGFFKRPAKAVNLSVSEAA